MGKKFGDRWEIIEQLPVRSGQADIFLQRTFEETIWTRAF
jgi:hypothetical protein